MNDTMNDTQLGADIGHILSYGLQKKKPSDLLRIAQEIIDLVGIEGITPIEQNVHFIGGLGWGIGNRKRIPVEDAVKELFTTIDEIAPGD